MVVKDEPISPFESPMMMGMHIPPPGHPHSLLPAPDPQTERKRFRAEVRNQTIDEMCDWLDSCIESVDHNDNVYKAGKAMVNALRGKKTTPDTSYPDEDHLPLTNKPISG
jgi:hypothetical protein